jgi:hypothetical protein
MKALFTLLLLVTAASGWAQEVPPPPLPVDARTKLITYSDVVPTPGVTQANLLVRARVWANRVSVPAKPPLVLNEMGTDVLIVAVSQSVVPEDILSITRLYLVAQVSLREGRYQYRFEDFTYEISGSSTLPVESYLLSTTPLVTKSEKRVAARARAQFDQAVGQAAATLREAMLTPLVTPLPNGTDW